MKKAYEAPKVEKMAFNYSDVVVASVSCKDKVVRTEVHHDGYVCEERIDDTQLGQMGT